MHFLNGVTILLIYQLVGEISVRLLEIPVPGPVLGMILLCLTLILRGRPSPSLNSASSALLAYLPLLFVPAGVGMMAHFDLIADQWIPIALALVSSTVITMSATAAIMLAASRLLSKEPKKNG